ncbi:MAG: SpoIIE family protein phosphatase [Planctomycetota bacterium]|nr:SpoIIE family protein phosphatase [Planctomycetota bacterium]
MTQVRPPEAPEVLPEAHLTEHPISVLLVDDQRIIGEAVRRMLAVDASIRYAFCDDPTQAIAMAREVEATVILSDLVMPQMDGLDLVKAIRAEPELARVPLIVLSSKEEAETKAKAFELGANDYLVKLPQPLELLARIRYHSAGYISMLQRDEAFDALEQSQAILKDDLAQAATYVESLLPPPITDGAVRTRSTFIPSASLGGDAFGYHWLDDDHFVVYLLDVSGHGVGAALLSVSVLNLLKTQSLRRVDFSDPGQVLAGLNNTFRPEEHGGRFFTIWYGVLHVPSRVLRYAGGGHPPAILSAPDTETLEQLESTGPIPGLVQGLPYDTLETSLPEGGRVLVFSDGLYELPLGDARVGTFGGMVADLESTHGGDVPPFDRAIDRARTLVDTAGFPDDVSVVEIQLAT